MASNFRFWELSLSISPWLSVADVHPATGIPLQVVQDTLSTQCKPAQADPPLDGPSLTLSLHLLSVSLSLMGRQLRVEISGAHLFHRHPALATQKGLSLPGVSPEQAIWAL